MTTDPGTQRTEHLYDTANRLTAQNWTVGSSSFTEQYTYNGTDGTLSSFGITSILPGVSTTTFSLNYGYDPLKRLVFNQGAVL